jgi:predicted DNA-binding transcriptional regulator YafY
VYRYLSAFVDLPVPIPAAVLHDLAARLPEGNAAALEQSAGLIRERLAQTIDGYAALPSPIAQADPVAIRAAIETAYASQGTLTIEYFSPGYGVPTVRTITPLLPITASGGGEYVEAWCHSADAARTFRVDRILRLVDGKD